MATRSIVTSQPDVACDVCGRRLLRGETPDTFLAGRDPRTVCELCAPRAAQEGWRRESDGDSLNLRPPRSRKGVSLLDRLRQLREPVQRYERGFYLGSVSADRSTEATFEPGADLDVDAGAAAAFGESAGIAVERGAEPEAGRGADSASERAADSAAELDAQPSVDLGLAHVLEVFNRGEQPRRVAGVARSLGAPSVSVQPLPGSDTRFTIVVAWEICWYRYEIDLSDEAAGAIMVQKGMELDELPPQERLGNAVADEQGELHPAA